MASAADAIASVADAPTQPKRPREEAAGGSLRDDVSEMRASIMDFLGSSFDRMADRMERRIASVGTELTEKIDAVGIQVQHLDARQEATARGQSELRQQLQQLARQLEEPRGPLEAD